MKKKSQDQICEIARQFKATCAKFNLISPDGSLLLPKIYEQLNIFRPGWQMLVKESDEMLDNLGITIPSEKIIALRNDVYIGMCVKDPEHCFTAAHELGHMVMHGEAAFARTEPYDGFTSVNFESEADIFATELLGFCSPAKQEVSRQLDELMTRLMQPYDAKKGPRNGCNIS